MCKKSAVRLLFMGFLLVSISIGATLAYADSSVSIVSGRLGATYDNKTGNVTAILAGYCEGKAVTVGPVTWAATQEEFSSLRTEDVAKIVCGSDFTLQKVTKSENSGKAIVADVLIVKLN
jgi:hypothetical protein